MIPPIAVTWTVMAFRTGDALIMQAFDDLGFFSFSTRGRHSPSGHGSSPLGSCATSTPSQPFLAEWLSTPLGPASLMGLFKAGPFAYNGLLAFWLVAIDFLLRLLVTSVVRFRVVANETRKTAQRQ